MIQNIFFSGNFHNDENYFNEFCRNDFHDITKLISMITKMTSTMTLPWQYRGSFVAPCCCLTKRLQLRWAAAMLRPAFERDFHDNQKLF